MEKEQEFTIRDRRSGTSETGDARPSNKSAEQKQAQPGPEARERQPAPGAAQDLDFSTFVISIASSAQVNLGAMPHPETNQTAQNFPATKQMIDILTILPLPRKAT